MNKRFTLLTFLLLTVNNLTTFTETLRYGATSSQEDNVFPLGNIDVGETLSIRIAFPSPTDQRNFHSTIFKASDYTETDQPTPTFGSSTFTVPASPGALTLTWGPVLTKDDYLLIIAIEGNFVREIQVMLITISK